MIWYELGIKKNFDFLIRIEFGYEVLFLIVILVRKNFIVIFVIVKRRVEKEYFINFMGI